MRLVILVEEQSMQELLYGLLPAVLPAGVDLLVIKHSGKSELRQSIPRKLAAWNMPDDRFIIIQDQDSQDDCKLLKSELASLCGDRADEVMVRIACRELESWYFGDLQAVSDAYDIKLTKPARSRKFRDPDSIRNPKNELMKLIPHHQQINGARLIAKHMDPGRNTSRSFQVLVRGIRALCADVSG